MPGRKFTPSVISRIISLADQGLSAEQIAERVGCNLGSLRVRCSQLGISLRRRKPAGGRRWNSGSASGKGEKQNSESSKRRTSFQNSSTDEPISGLSFGLVVSLSDVTVNRIRNQAALMRISDSALAAALLQAIVDDDLYEAVLNQAKNSG